MGSTEALARANAAGRKRSLVRRAYHKLKIVAYRQPALRATRLLHNVNFRMLLHTQGSYQPVLQNGRFVGADPRDCTQRWDIIEPHLPPGARSALDLGCAQGFFTVQLARRGLIAIGVDNLASALDLAWHQCRINDIPGVGFVKEDITHEFVERLPQFDVVVFLSLMHHLIYIHGVEWCAELLRRLRRKVNMALFFEMGQSNEYFHEWHTLLPDMGPNPSEWIGRFLEAQGFRAPQVIGSVPADKYEDPLVHRAVIKAG